MLLLLNQFLLKHAVRTHLYLPNPPIVHQDELTLPRFSVIHYLDLTSDIKFIDRGLYYFSPIGKNKKIPVQTIDDLTRKEGTTSLHNKYLPAETRKWLVSNLKSFKRKDLLIEPNKESTVVGVINYNGLKDLYNYQMNLLYAYNYHRNLSETYWSTVKTAVQDKDSVQVVSITLPTLIPSRHILDKLLEFSPVKQHRVISDKALHWVLDIYRWLSDSTRENSPITLTDEESERVLIEFKYKGYSSFILLSTLRRVAAESTLKSSFKLEKDKLNKLYLLFLNAIQNKVNALLENTEVTEEPLNVNDSNDDIPDELNSDTDSDLDEESIIQPEPLKVEGITRVSDIHSLKEMDEINLNSDKEDKSLLDLVNSDELNDSYINTYFEKELNRVSKEPIMVVTDSSSEEESTPIKSYSEEETSELLATKTSEEQINHYLSVAVIDKTMTSTEIRNLRKLLETRKTLKDPYTEKETLNDSLIKKPKDIPLVTGNTAIPVKSSLVAERLKTNIIGNFDKKYVNEILKKDILDCVRNLEQGDVIIKDYTVEEVNTVTDRYETHKLTLKPINGKESTIYFRIPKIDSEGRFMAAGTTYIQRKVRTD